MLDATTVYKKLTNGDSLTDEEVQFGYEFYHDLEQKLGQCDQVFTLAWREARRVADHFSSFIEARQYRTFVEARKSKGFKKLLTS